MSTSYYVVCADCSPDNFRDAKEGCTFPDNHVEFLNSSGLDLLQKSFLAAPKIHKHLCDLHKELSNDSSHTMTIEVQLCNWKNIDAGWFILEHGNHQLVMVDEYGRWFPFSEMAN